MDFDFPSFDFVDDDTVTREQLPANLKLEKRVAKREFAIGLRHESLIHLVPALPPPDTDMVIISTGDGAEGRHGSKEGKFDFGDFLPHAIGLLGGRGCTAFVSTWCVNYDHVTMMLDLLKTKKLEKLTFFSDPYLQSRTPAVAGLLMVGLAEYPKRARFKLFANHTKIIAVMDKTGKHFCTVTGSANMNMQMRAEQYWLSTSGDVFHWITTEFFEAMLIRPERKKLLRGKRKPKPGKGGQADAT